VAGPPKRFAQGIGFAFSLSALILTILGDWTAAEALAPLATSAYLKSALGICLGCKAFAALMGAGVAPTRCADAATTSGPHPASPERAPSLSAVVDQHASDVLEQSLPTRCRWRSRTM
jgi:Domain of unknown function (DUF4395)